MKFGSPVRASIFAEGLAGGGAGGLDGGIAAAGVATAAACGCDLPTAGWAAREGFERICARGTFRLPQPYGGAYTIWAIYARRFDNRPSRVPRYIPRTPGNGEETLPHLPMQRKLGFLDVWAGPELWRPIHNRHSFVWRRDLSGRKTRFR